MLRCRKLRAPFLGPLSFLFQIWICRRQAAHAPWTRMRSWRSQLHSMGICPYPDPAALRLPSLLPQDRSPARSCSRAALQGAVQSLMPPGAATGAVREYEAVLKPLVPRVAEKLGS